MSEETKESLPSAEILRMTSSVVAAYLHNNPLPSTELPSVIQTIHGSLTALNNGSAKKVRAAETCSFDPPLGDP